VDNPLFVCCFQRLGNLPRDRQRLNYGYAVGPYPHGLPLLADARRASLRQPSSFSGAARNHFRECRPFDELEDEGANTIRFLQAINRANMRMIQRGQQPRLGARTARGGLHPR
jgi:hypothetical protein